MNQMKRIALMIPHTDVTLETDLQRFLPHHYILHTQRMWLDQVDEASEKNMVDHELPKAVNYLKSIGNLNMAVFGCTSASAVYGSQGEEKIRQNLTTQLNCPGITALSAVVDQIRKNEGNRIAMITPYSHDVNQFMVDVLHEYKINVDYHDGMGLLDDTAISQVDPSRIESFVEDRAEYIRKMDLCFISCTNFRAMEIRQRLEQTLKKRVITSNFSIYQQIIDM